METHRIGLGLASLTGSKLATQILSRTGHCINYSEVKSLETEFAYSTSRYECDVPDGINLAPDVGTASVWDNNDAQVETLDGKNTLHATVGHAYQNVVRDDYQASLILTTFREGRNHRHFSGKERDILPFKKSIRTAIFVSSTAHSATSHARTLGNTADPPVEVLNEFKIPLTVLDLF